MPLMIKSHPKKIAKATDDIAGWAIARMPATTISALWNRYQSECRLTFSRIASAAASIDIDMISLHQLLQSLHRIFQRLVRHHRRYDSRNGRRMQPELFFLRRRLGIHSGDGLDPNDMIFDLLDARNVLGGDAQRLTLPLVGK